ncbi:MAG: MBL fold metallo-hydrolase [Candidatus Diapherotrites archaeon]
MIEETAPNLFSLISSNESCNAYLLNGAAPALIDSGLSSNKKNLAELLSKAGISFNDIRLILHTHSHADHWGADSLFPKAEIRMHEAGAKPVNERNDLLTANNWFNEEFPKKIKNFLKPNETISLSPFTLKVLHTPGHTAGGVCFLEQRLGLLFSGDTLFKGGIGRTDLPSSNAKQLLSSLQLLAKQDFSVLLPGHGELLKGKEKQKKNIVSLGDVNI